MITVIHPSRGRSQMGYAAREQWSHFAGGEFQHILSIDQDDPQISEYRKWPFSEMHNIIINRNRSIVDAVNNAAKFAKGDLLVVMSDDFRAPVDWIKSLMDIYGKVGAHAPFALLVADGIQTKLETMTLPILNSALYKKLGYIYYPDYFSVFCDNDITEVCRRMNCLHTAPSLLFEHRHYINGKNKIDETYKRENSEEAFKIGHRVYKERESRNFNL